MDMNAHHEPLPHALAADVLAAQLEVPLNIGLSTGQVSQLYERYRPNQLPDAPMSAAWRVFVFQFKRILILILIGAALLAAAIGNLKDAFVILAVVLINASIGFYQEYRVEQSLAPYKPCCRYRRGYATSPTKSMSPPRNLFLATWCYSRPAIRSRLTAGYSLLPVSKQTNPH